MSSGQTRQEFGPLFHELLSTRARYEALRIGNGSLLERAMLLDHLHELRHDMRNARPYRV